MRKEILMFPGSIFLSVVYKWAMKIPVSDSICWWAAIPAMGDFAILLKPGGTTHYIYMAVCQNLVPL